MCNSALVVQSIQWHCVVLTCPVYWYAIVLWLTLCRVTNQGPRLRGAPYSTGVVRAFQRWGIAYHPRHVIRRTLDPRFLSYISPDDVARAYYLPVPVQRYGYVVQVTVATGWGGGGVQTTYDPGFLTAALVSNFDCEKDIAVLST